MIDDMGRDLEKDIAEAKRDEEEAQKDYEEEMNDAATKRSDDSKLLVTKEGEKAEKAGVIAMIDDMGRDLEKDIAEAKRDEEEAQKDYEEDMNDAATKRADDSKLLVTKEGEKAKRDEEEA